MDQVLRVLVVDDSAYVRKVIKQMLSLSPFIEVVGAARDGKEALEMVEQLKPDVITLDLIMPELDGVGFLHQQMARRPIPVIIVSIAGENNELALEALEAGAIDFLQKPTALATEKVFEISDELIEKVKAAAKVRMPQVLAQRSNVKSEETRLYEANKVNPGKNLIDIVVLGISTGGPQGLRFLIPQLPANLPIPMAIVIHMPLGYTELYASKLNEISSLKVIEAYEGAELQAGVVMIAAAGRHLSLRRRPEGKVVAHLDARPFDKPHRPSVDVLFQSAADAFHERVLGIVMTGMGSDGKEGAAWIKSQGGMIFTEAEETCVVYGMPSSVVEAGLSDRAVPLTHMAQAILEIV